jgi:hypothetical protein
MLQALSLDTLNQVDYGKASIAFQRLVRQAVQDCMDRPVLKKPRKVQLTMTINPVTVINGNTIDCESVKGSFQMKILLPNMETDPIDFGIRNNGDIVFNPDAPDNHKQQTFMEDEAPVDRKTASAP